LRGFSPRGFNPRSAITRHLFDDLDDDPFGGLIKPGEIKPNGYAASTGWGTPVYRPLQPGERAPFDPDAT
jgi:sec-independent protein translocase protein TatB